MRYYIECKNIHYKWHHKWVSKCCMYSICYIECQNIFCIASIIYYIKCMNTFQIERTPVRIFNVRKSLTWKSMCICICKYVSIHMSLYMFIYTLHACQNLSDAPLVSLGLLYLKRTMNVCTTNTVYCIDYTYTTNHFNATWRQLCQFTVGEQYAYV